MTPSRFSEAQIVKVLKSAEAGVPIDELCREHGINRATFDLWRKRFGGLEVNDATRLTDLEDDSRLAEDRRQQIKKALAKALEHQGESRAEFLHDLSIRDPEMAEELRWLLKAEETPTVDTAVPQSFPRSGDSLSHYRLIEFIGEGGMGVVFKARDTQLDRDVAIKVLQPELMTDPGRCRRFVREARAAASINHPNIATVYEIGESQGTTFIAMELVKGTNLRSLVRAGPLDVKEALRICVGALAGLSRAHASGVVHRDLKPDNIVITEDGHAKILDFGLAKYFEPTKHLSAARKERSTSTVLTGKGSRLGTASYMSPEQARGEVVGPPSDIFSLGVTLYELLTGQTPFQRVTQLDTLNAVVDDEHTPASRINRNVPTSLDRILDKCLAKEPGSRYADCDTLRQTLDVQQRRLAVSWRRTRRVSAAIAVALALAIGVWWGWFRTPAVPTGPIVSTVAVAPLIDLAEDPRLTWYGEGVADLLRNNLAQSSHLTIVSRGLSYDESRPEFLDSLVESGVDYLVTGEILPTAEGLTMIVRLSDLATGADLPAHRIDGLDKDELLRASEDVATTLRLHLGVPSTEQVDVFAADFAAENPAAYQAYLRGLQLLLDYQHQDAAEAFLIALGHSPNYTMARYRLAQVQATTGHTREASANIKQAASESDGLTNREIAYIRAAEAYIDRRYDDAIQIYEEILARNPHELEARFYVSRFLSEMERYEQAIAHLNLLSALDRDNEVTWSLLGDAQLHLRRCDDAELAVNEYIRLSPGSPNAHHQRGEVFRCRGEFEQAARAYATALETDPTQIYAALSLATMNVLLGRVEIAERDLRAIVDGADVVAATRIDAAFDLASIYRASGRFAEAARLLASIEDELAEEEIREAMALAIRGLSWLELGDETTARQLIDLAIERTPTVPTRYLFARGILELAEQRPAAVRRTAELILEGALPAEDPDRTEDRAAAFLGGMAALQENDVENAVESLRRAVELTGHPYADYRLGLAEAMIRLGLHQDALELANRVESDVDAQDPRLDLQLDRTRAILMRARIHQSLGDREKAVSLAHRFLEIWQQADASLPDLELARQIAADDGA